MRCSRLLTLLAACVVTGCGPEISREDLGEVHFTVPEVPGSPEVYELPADLLPKPEPAKKSVKSDVQSGDDSTAKASAAKEGESKDSESKDSESKDSESKDSESKESESKESESKESVDKSKENGGEKSE